jgi:two-component system OmpR family response regulator
MRILLVEDEARLAQLLSQALREESHEVDVCDDGAVAADQAELVPYDVIVLDWVLPGLDGLALLRRWRSKGMNQPVLLLSARGTVGERVQALRAGADDYVVKPIALSELSARVEALHRRSHGHERVRELGDLQLDIRSRNVTGPAGSQSLSAREFAVLVFLLDRQADVVTRSELLTSVWGPAFAGSPNVVDVYVGYVRGKLAATGCRGLTLDTVRGVGYRLRSTSHSTKPGSP